MHGASFVDIPIVSPRGLIMRRSLFAALLSFLAITLAAACGADTPAPTSPSTAAPPVISLFASDSATVTAAAPATVLRWEVLDNTASVRIDPFPGNVPAVSSAQIVPVGTTTYTLVARNVYGSTQRFVTVVVK